MNEYTLNSLGTRAAADFRMAQAATAPKTDSRYYLRGLQINFGTGEVTGTDGHRLATSKCFSADAALTVIVRFDKAVPRNAETLRLVIKATDGHIENGQILDGDAMLFCHSTRGAETIIRGTIINGVYPDFERVVPKDVPGEPVPEITFNPLLIAELVKAAGFNMPGCTFMFPVGDSDAMRVKVRDSDARIVIMPMRK